MTESLGGMLEETLKKLGLGGAVAAIYWRQVVGEEVSRHAQPLRQMGKTLFVATDNPVWSQELSLQKAAILKKLEQKMGKGRIGDIKFITRGVDEDETAEAEETAGPPLSEGQKREIAGLLAAVKEPVVKNSLRHLLEKDHRKRRERSFRNDRSG
jgi:hypothetical protein